jgi:AraC family transcriptional regulator
MANAIPMLPMSPHQGQITDKEEISSVTVVKILYRANTYLPKHAHKHACFVSVQRGGHTEVLGSKRFAVQPGRALFRPAGAEHCDVFTSVGTTSILVELADRWFHSMDVRSSISRESSMSCAPQISKIIWEIGVEVQRRDSVSTLAMEGLTSLLAAEFIRSSRVERAFYPPRWLRQVYEQVSDDPCTRFDLRELARQALIHPAHLSREFRRYYHLNLWEFIRRRRIAVAADLITKRQHSFADIAQMVGYSDQSHFTRAFRHVMGTTPSAYRLTSA